MWRVTPTKMCDRHLLGEHAEMHMFIGTINRGKSIKGFLEKKLVEVHHIRERHDRLVREMEKRGMNHKSLLPQYKEVNLGRVDIRKNEKELKKRCRECRKR